MHDDHPDAVEVGRHKRAGPLRQSGVQRQIQLVPSALGDIIRQVPVQLLLIHRTGTRDLDHPAGELGDIVHIHPQVQVIVCGDVSGVKRTGEDDIARLHSCLQPVGALRVAAGRLKRHCAAVPQADLGHRVEGEGFLHRRLGFRPLVGHVEVVDPRLRGVVRQPHIQPHQIERQGGEGLHTHRLGLGEREIQLVPAVLIRIAQNIPADGAIDKVAAIAGQLQISLGGGVEIRDVHPHMQVVIPRDVGGGKPAAEHRVARGIAGGAHPVGGRPVGRLNDQGLVAKPRGRILHRVERECRRQRLLHPVEIRDARRADAKPVVLHVRVVLQCQHHLVLTGRTEMQHVLDIHIPRTEIRPVDGLPKDAVHPDFQVAGLGCQRKEQVEIAAVHIEGQGGPHGGGLPALGAQLIDARGVVIGPAIHAHLSVLGFGEVLHQHRIVEAVVGDALGQCGVLLPGLDVFVQDLPLHVLDQQLGQQLMPLVGGMDMVGGPDVEVPQPHDVGRQGELIVRGAEADLRNAVGLVDLRLAVLDIVSVLRAHVGVDGRDPRLQQLGQDALIGLGAIGQAIVVGAKVHDDQIRIVGKHIPLQPGDAEHAFGGADTRIDEDDIPVFGIAVQALQPVAHQSCPLVARSGNGACRDGIAQCHQGDGLPILGFLQHRGDGRLVVVRAEIEKRALVRLFYRLVIGPGVDLGQFGGHRDLVDPGLARFGQHDDHPDAVDRGDVKRVLALRHTVGDREQHLVPAVLREIRADRPGDLRVVHRARAGDLHHPAGDLAQVVHIHPQVQAPVCKFAQILRRREVAEEEHVARTGHAAGNPVGVRRMAARCLERQLGAAPRSEGIHRIQHSRILVVIVAGVRHEVTRVDLVDAGLSGLRPHDDHPDAVHRGDVKRVLALGYAVRDREIELVPAGLLQVGLQRPGDLRVVHRAGAGDLHHPAGDLAQVVHIHPQVQAPVCKFAQILRRREVAEEEHVARTGHAAGNPVGIRRMAARCLERQFGAAPRPEGIHRIQHAGLLLHRRFRDDLARVNLVNTSCNGGVGPHDHAHGVDGRDVERVLALRYAFRDRQIDLIPAGLLQIGLQLPGDLGIVHRARAGDLYHTTGDLAQVVHIHPQVQAAVCIRRQVHRQEGAEELDIASLLPGGGDPDRAVLKAAGRVERHR